MTDRERLIELVKNSLSAYGNEARADCKPQDFIADFLIANGVIVPPCKVGDTVYYIAGKKIYKSKCHAITLQPSMQIHLYDYDGDNTRYSTKDVFLAREEAEKVLKEREGKK